MTLVKSTRYDQFSSLEIAFSSTQDAHQSKELSVAGQHSRLVTSVTRRFEANFYYRSETVDFEAVGIGQLTADEGTTVANERIYTEASGGGEQLQLNG